MKILRKETTLESPPPPKKKTNGETKKKKGEKRRHLGSMERHKMFNWCLGEDTKWQPEFWGSIEGAQNLERPPAAPQIGLFSEFSGRPPAAPLPYLVVLVSLVVDLQRAALIIWQDLPNWYSLFWKALCVCGCSPVSFRPLPSLWVNAISTKKVSGLKPWTSKSCGTYGRLIRWTQMEKMAKYK